MIQKFFNRYEIKYKISLKERDNLIQYINPFMELDSHAKNNYDYEVRSLYFDSPFGKSYYEKVDGIKTRVKLRIRYYPDFQNREEELVFIELKRKNNENVSKSRIVAPMEKALQIIDIDTEEAQKFFNDSTNQEKKKLKEIWYLYRRYSLHPVCLVCYKRQPYISKFERTFRLTFDTNIQVRDYNFDLKVGGGSKFILLRNICVLEIKFNNFIPNWAIKIVQKSNCIQEKISKFASGLNTISKFL